MKYIITERQYRLLSEEEDKVEDLIELLKKSTDLEFDFDALSNDWDLVLRLSKKKPFIIKGDLDLRDVEVVTLGSLVGVGGDLDLGYHENFTDFKNLQYVGGNLNLFGSAIKSLGNLVYVKGNLDLEFSNIESLGNLKYVGGYLYSYNTNITSLEKLESVGSYLNLGLSKIESLGNLKYVGNYLDLMNTPFSEKKTKEDIRNIPNLTIGGEIYL